MFEKTMLIEEGGGQFKLVIRKLKNRAGQDGEKILIK